MSHSIRPIFTAVLGGAALLASSAPQANAQQARDAHFLRGLTRGANSPSQQPRSGVPNVVFQDTIRGGCVSGSTCITFDPVAGPDGGTITFPAAPADALPIFGYLYFQYLTLTDCSVDRMGDFANATVNGVNINTVPFVEIGCRAASACFPASATHFYRVDVSSLFDDCDLNVASFELRNFGMGNDSDSDWVEGATLMVAYCSESSPATDVILVEDPQVYGSGVDSQPSIVYSWGGFNATGGNATLVLGIGNGQSVGERVSFSTNTTPDTLLGETGFDSFFDGDLCAPGPFGNGGFYDNTIVDVTGLVNVGDSSATFTVLGTGDCLDSNAAFLCVESLSSASNCVPDACQEIGCFTLDFELDDSLTPLVHGQHIGDGDPEFDGGPDVPVAITSSVGGSNADTAAILDSNNGPAAQDPDLLVGRGNILILQTDANTNECPPGSDVYCSHNDDEDGGRLSFAFPGPTTPSSVVLIDIDSTDAVSTVVLTDGTGARRTYSIPANWTGDFVTDATPGWKLLDLTDTNDQAGFGSTATASDDAGFDPTAVIRIDVNLGGSGGVDSLTWCVTPAPIQHASARLRHGSGVNPTSLSFDSLPVIGQTFQATLDCTAEGSGLAVLEVRQRPSAGRMTPYGEPLIDGDLVHRATKLHSGSTNQLDWSVPNDISLCGLNLYVQGLCIASEPSNGSRVQRIRGRLSNSIDLVLGF